MSAGASAFYSLGRVGEVEMRRNMDLVRTLMLRFEELPMEMGDAVTIMVGDKRLAGIEATDAEMLHHLELIRDEGFLDCPDGGQPMLGITYMGLTWRGHDFTDSIRNEEVWGKTKAAATRAGGWTASLLIEIAKAVIKGELAKYLPGL
jgi:hypothetical protein